MGDAGGATIINFMALGAFRPDGSVDDEKMATLLADPNLKEKALAANALVDPKAAGKKPEEEAVLNDGPEGCTHPNMMENLATYIADEMNNNIHHPSVLKMKELLSYDVAEETRKQMDLPWYAQLGATSPQVIGASNVAAAMALWTEKVGQGCDWDHKPKIHAKFGRYRHRQGKYDYYYDIWSNIHYGYVGMAGGLTEGVLLDGAGAEQIVSDQLRKWEEQVFVAKDQQRLKGPRATEGVEGLRAWDDVPDRTSISIGIKLFNDYPLGSVPPQAIVDAVLVITPEGWGEGVSIHVCENY
jgi:hypothetical protein